eukprot:COSAG02_NODE_4799_length_4963_cov_5.231497_2_plen_214_part_00
MRAQHARASDHMAAAHAVPTLPVTWPGGHRRLQLLYDYFEEEDEGGSGKSLFVFLQADNNSVAASVPIRRPTGCTRLTLHRSRRAAGVVSRRLSEPCYACCRFATHEFLFWRRLHAVSENSVMYGLQPPPRETESGGRSPKPLNQFSPECVDSPCKQGSLPPGSLLLFEIIQSLKQNPAVANSLPLHSRAVAAHCSFASWRHRLRAQLPDLRF